MFDFVGSFYLVWLTKYLYIYISITETCKYTLRKKKERRRYGMVPIIDGLAYSILLLIITPSLLID